MKRGEIYYIFLGRGYGSEQGGLRPCVIVSNDKCNEHCNVVEVVLITTKQKTLLPTHVAINECVHGTILCEHVRSVDKSRFSERRGMASAETMQKVNNALKISLGLGEVC